MLYVTARKNIQSDCEHIWFSWCWQVNDVDRWTMLMEVSLALIANSCTHNAWLENMQFTGTYLLTTYMHISHPHIHVCTCTCTTPPTFTTLTLCQRDVPSLQSTAPITNSTSEPPAPTSNQVRRVDSEETLTWVLRHSKCYQWLWDWSAILSEAPTVGWVCWWAGVAYALNLNDDITGIANRDLWG